MNSNFTEYTTIGNSSSIGHWQFAVFPSSSVLPSNYLSFGEGPSISFLVTSFQDIKSFSFSTQDNINNECRCWLLDKSNAKAEPTCPVLETSFHSYRPRRSYKKLTYARDQMLSWIVLVVYFDLVSEMVLGSQFTLKSMLTRKELVSKKFIHGKLVTLILFCFKLCHFTEENLSLTLDCCWR